MKRIVVVLFVFVISNLFVNELNAEDQNPRNIELADSSSSITINKKDQLYYKTTTWGSVGKEVKTVTDRRYIRKTVSSKYVNPYYGPPIVGGDEKETTFCFKAIRRGKTQIIIKHIFRGELSREIVIDLDIK